MFFKKSQNKKGFSVVELLVTVAIVTVLATTALFVFNSSNDSLSINSAAQELQFSIKKAQSYALNAKELTPGTGNFSYAYGLYFNPTEDPSSYYIFADADQDGKFVPTPTSCTGIAGDECVEKLALPGGVHISNMCSVVIQSGEPVCDNLTSNSLYLTFLRPSPEIEIVFNPPPCDGRLCPMPFVMLSTNAKIELTSPKGDRLLVHAQKINGITIEDPDGESVLVTDPPPSVPAGPPPEEI